ncbi:MAG: 5'/3'-nucleotidase SurE [Abitibacteriaceae bacterium]|nr:5'/3'-nucleotidase SurE [Abditibacteriaceae bacterium]MBV9866080.1 5'/3'-nucleotidase SurE [Abditibacteriaceae bacterium]
MQILLTNDDGVHAPGLHAAWRALNAAGHNVFVCVPDRPRSACSHSITMHKPLRANQVATPDGIAHTCNGTPADCVPLAFLQLMPAPPDLVISGINLGPNLGDDVHYSGTVAGAMEGMLNGVPSFGISLAGFENPQWEPAGKFCAEFAAKMVGLALPRDTFVNVNVPNLSSTEIKGVRITSQGSRRYKGDIVRYEAPIIGAYYWRGGEIIDRSERDDTDIRAIQENYISVTPLHVDLTRYDALVGLQQLF